MITEDRIRGKADQDADSMRQIALAVVGMPRSGKSTFVQHALDLKKLPTSRISTKKVSLEGVVSILRIHEFDPHDIEITSRGTPFWPIIEGGGSPVEIEGALVIYNISDVGTTRPLPALLREFDVLATVPIQAALSIARNKLTLWLLSLRGLRKNRIANSSGLFDVRYTAKVTAGRESCCKTATQCGAWQCADISNYNESPREPQTMCVVHTAQYRALQEWYDSFRQFVDIQNLFLIDLRENNIHSININFSRGCLV